LQQWDQGSESSPEEEKERILAGLKEILQQEKAIDEGRRFFVLPELSSSYLSQVAVRPFTSLFVFSNFRIYKHASSSFSFLWQ
jgi:hypothetical protein